MVSISKHSIRFKALLSGFKGVEVFLVLFVKNLVFVRFKGFKTQLKDILTPPERVGKAYGKGFLFRHLPMQSRCSGLYAGAEHHSLLPLLSSC